METNSKVCYLGNIQLDFNLKISKEELINFNIDPSTLTTLSALKPLLENEELKSKIYLSSKNNFSNLLLFSMLAVKKAPKITFLHLSSFAFNDPVFNEIINSFFAQTRCSFLSLDIVPIINTSQFIIHCGDDKYRTALTFKNASSKVDGNPFSRITHSFEKFEFLCVDMDEINSHKSSGITVEHFHQFLSGLIKQHPKLQTIVNYPNIIENIADLDIENIERTQELLGFTDFFIFERKEAKALFNILNSLKDETYNETEEDLRNLEMLFLKEVEKERKKIPKIGIFVDELEKIGVIEQHSETNLILFHTNFNLDLIASTTEMLQMKGDSKEKSEKNKKFITINYEILKAAFLGSFLSQLYRLQPFNVCFETGQKTVKSMLNFVSHRGEVEMPSSFSEIQIKMSKKRFKKLPQSDEIKIKKEDMFTLDCTNVLNCRMKPYMPLLDQSLESYFASPMVKKHLVCKGFINRKGLIKTDPDKLNRNRQVKNNAKLQEVYEKQVNSLVKLIDVNTKTKIQLNSIFKSSERMVKNQNFKDLTNFAKVYNFYPTAKQKVPGLNYDWDKHPFAPKKIRPTKLKPLRKAEYNKILVEFEEKAQDKGMQANSEE